MLNVSLRKSNKVSCKKKAAKYVPGKKSAKIQVLSLADGARRRRLLTPLIENI